MSAPAHMGPVETWLYELFAASDDLAALVDDRILLGEAPAGTAFPFIIFAPYGNAGDVRAVPNESVMLDGSYVIGGVCEGASFEDADAVYALVDGLLQASTSGSGIVSVTREFAVRYAEERDGNRYRHSKGVYRIQAGGV